MWISNSKSLLRDLVIASAVAALIALVASPTDPALAAWPVHPAWIVAQVLAARYGASGLYGVPAVLLGGQLAAWLAGLHGIAMLARLERPGDVAALIAVAIIAVIGAIQHNRRGLLE